MLGIEAAAAGSITPAQNTPLPARLKNQILCFNKGVQSLNPHAHQQSWVLQDSKFDFLL